jgi:hypothetical protein
MASTRLTHEVSNLLEVERQCRSFSSGAMDIIESDAELRRKWQSRSKSPFISRKRFIRVSASVSKFVSGASHANFRSSDDEDESTASNLPSRFLLQS